MNDITPSKVEAMLKRQKRAKIVAYIVLIYIPIVTAIVIWLTVKC